MAYFIARPPPDRAGDLFKILMLRVLSPLSRAVTGLNRTLRVPAAVRGFSSDQPIFEVSTGEEFAERVVNSPVPVIVDFHAEWCGPCQTLGPRLEQKILGRQGQVLLAKVDIDYAGELATDYQISVVPTVLSFKNGAMVNSFQGAVDDSQLDAFIDEVLNH